MESLANCSNRDWRLVKSLHKLAWLLIVGLQVSCLTACAEEARPLHDVSKIRKTQQDTPVMEPFVDSSKSKLPLPSQKMLDVVLSNAKCFRVLDCGLDADGKLCSVYNSLLREKSSGKVIFESSEPMVLKDLTRYLRIAEGTQFPEDSRNFLMGTPTFELTLVDGRKVHIGLIGSNLRWNAWRHDAYLLHPVALIIWLGEHGAMRPLRDIEARFDYAKHIYKRDVVSFDEFVRAMPKSLREFFGTIKRLESTLSLEDMSEKYAAIPEAKRLKLARAELSKQFPNESDQIGVLLQWYGKITSVRNAYQSFPIELLMEYDPSQVLPIIKGSSLSSAQWVGVSRYYSSYYFRKKFPSGYKPLDKALRERIIKNVKSTGKNQSDVDSFEEAIRNWLR